MHFLQLSAPFSLAPVRGLSASSQPLHLQRHRLKTTSECAREQALDIVVPLILIMQPIPVSPVHPSAVEADSEKSDGIEMDGLPFSFFRELVDANGGEAAFEGLTTSNVKRNIIVPKTQSTKLSLCAQMRQEGDSRVKTATWFVSHAWQYKFLDVFRALEAFFADKPEAIIWMDIVSTSQHATFERPPEWWQQTFVSAIGRMGQMVMIMTPWDNPVCLTRAWCLIELYACRSSGSLFGVALPPSERARFLSQIVSKAGAFYDMLGKVNTEKSECNRDSDRQRIFSAIRGLDGGFTSLDRSVLKSLTEWLVLQLQGEIASAASMGAEETECELMSALGDLFQKMGEFDRALLLLEECLTRRRRILGDGHHNTLATLSNVASLIDDKGDFARALPMFQECLVAFQRIHGSDHVATLESLNHVASTLQHMGHHDRALPLLEQCLAGKRRTLGDDHLSTITTLQNFVEMLYKRNDRIRAVPLLTECLARQRRIFGEDHPQTLASLNRLALDSGSNFDRALSLHQEVLSKYRRIFGDDHPNTLLSLNNMAVLHFENGHYDRALPLYEECLARRKRTLGDDHPSTLLTLNNIAFLWYSRRQYSRALPMYNELVERSRRALGADHPDTRDYQNDRDNCSHQAGCCSCM